MSKNYLISLKHSIKLLYLPKCVPHNSNKLSKSNSKFLIPHILIYFIYFPTKISQIYSFILLNIGYIILYTKSYLIIAIDYMAPIK